MNYKSKRAKATDIPKKVKERVYERDKGRCILCGSNQGIPDAHYLRRSQGGLGIEQNIVTLCIKCHDEYDNGPKRAEYAQRIHDYLQLVYGDCWNEKDLIYSKWRH